MSQMKCQMPESEIEIPLSKTNCSKPGIQRDLKVLLTREIQFLVNKGVLKGNRTIDVKLRGDGTVVGRWHYVNITCTVLNDETELRYSTPKEK